MIKNLKIETIPLFEKIFIAFLAAIIPIYMVSVDIITIGKNEIRKEIIESSNSKIDIYMNSLENEFYNIEKLENKLINDRDIVKLSRIKGLPSAYDDFSSYYAIQDKLKDIQDISKYVMEAKVYIMSQGKAVTSDSVEDYRSDETDKLKKVVRSYSYPFGYIDGDIYIVVSPYFLTNEESEKIDPKFIISIKISKDELKKGIQAFFNQEKGGVVLLGDSNGLSIADKQNEKMFPEFYKYVAKQNKIGNGLQLDKLNIDNTNFIINKKKSLTLRSTLIIYEPEEKFFNSLRVYSKWLWLISLLTLIAVTLFSSWMRGKIVRPISKLVSAFKDVEKGKFQISVDYNSNDEFSYLYKRFNEMVTKLNTLVQEVFVEKIHAKNAELKQLQYQINPHFLYNCFFLINRMAKMEDEEGVIKLTHHLGNYYQFVTRSSTDEVQLIKEINHAKDYTEVQAIRFNNRINVEFEELPGEFENIMVPRLILQPLIENAYKHGLKNVISDGKIYITFNKAGNILEISVEDNGNTLSEETLTALKEKLLSNDNTIETTGLLNVHRRLQIKYGQQGGLNVSRGKSGGLRVTERIVLRGEDKNV
ncbi:MAG: histidine kinase [Clostridiales bacterium]|nr:histidine kinase [Clostridiales bacterium]